jgi:hypothetical protein
VQEARQKDLSGQELHLQRFLSALKQKDVDVNALTRTGASVFCLLSSCLLNQFESIELN